MSNDQGGFTLIELMIVVAIIGILAAVAIPMYLDYSVRSQIAEGINLTASAKTAVSEFYQENGAFPADNAAAALPAPGEIQGKYVASVTINGADIAVMFGNDANVQIIGETILLTATDDVGSLSWACASGGVIQGKHLPTACR